MKTIAIIAEYNPLHLGHIYQINQIRQMNPNARIIAIVSGTLVQRGDFSILNKFYKAKSSIANGIDLVIELPTICSLQSADNFARGAVEILDKLGIVDYLAFGIDSPDQETFSLASDFLLENYQEIYDRQKTFIDQGHSYKSSFEMAVNHLLECKCLSIDMTSIFKPNNTLALQYMRSLTNINSNIKPLPILRNDGGYDSKVLDYHQFQSATTIRDLYLQGNTEGIKPYVPIETLDYLKNGLTLPQEFYNISSIEDLSRDFHFMTKVLDKKADLVAGYEPGILNLLVNNFDESLLESIDKSVNKRHSRSRLNRFVMNYLLGIDADTVSNMAKINYIRPLAFNDKGAGILKEIKDNSDIYILNKLRDMINLDEYNQEVLGFDIKAYNLISGKTKEFYSYDYKHNPYLKEEDD